MYRSPACQASSGASLGTQRPTAPRTWRIGAALLAMSALPLLAAATQVPGKHARTPLASSAKSQHRAPPEPAADVMPDPGAMALLASALVLLGRLSHRLDPVGATV